MHFLITGATGMIGSALISSLQASHQVTAYTITETCTKTIHRRKMSGGVHHNFG